MKFETAVVELSSGLKIGCGFFNMWIHICRRQDSIIRHKPKSQGIKTAALSVDKQHIACMFNDVDLKRPGCIPKMQGLSAK